MLLLVSVAGVNLVTIGADLEAGAAALGLLLHVDQHWLRLPLAAVLLAPLLLHDHHRLEQILKWVRLVLLAYVLAAFPRAAGLARVLRATVEPQIRLDGSYLEAALAILGTP